MKKINIIKATLIFFLVSGCLLGPIAPVVAASFSSHINAVNTRPTLALAQSPTRSSPILRAQTNRGGEWEPPEREVREGFWAWLRGLGRRGPCSDLYPPLIALVPALPSGIENPTVSNGFEAVQIPSGVGELSDLEFASQGLALTVSAHPRFWFYIPDQVDAEQVEFMIQDIDGEDLLDKPIQAHLRTGLVNIQLPSTLAGLEVNQPYHWYFSVVCDAERPSRNPHVDGWTERINPDDAGITIAELRQRSPQDQLNQYNQLNIWNETVDVLAEKQCLKRQASQFSQYWTILLADILPGVGTDWVDPLTYCEHPESLEIIAGNV